MTIDELVRCFGSPLYMYSLHEVRQAYLDLRAALPHGSLLYYSVKANPHPVVVAELLRLGCLAEVSSAGESAVALQAGAHPELCVYTSPGKTRVEIREALTAGLTLFSVDSPTQLQAVSDVCEALGIPARVLLRVNPDATIPGWPLSMGGSPSQFGADAAWIREAPEQFCGTRWARLVGFHIYPGTNVAEVEALLRSLSVAIETVVSLSSVLGIRPELVDLGGGFGHPFAVEGSRPDLSGLRAPLEFMLDGSLPGWRKGEPKLAFESGRYLVAAAGKLITMVQDVKLSQGRRFVVLDSGIHHLGGMSGLRRIPNVGARPVPTRGDCQSTPLHQVDVVGPLCTPLDAWSRGISLPHVEPGDLLMVPNVGAYGLTASLIAFLSRQTPAEVILDGDEIREASQMVIQRSILY